MDKLVPGMLEGVDTEFAINVAFSPTDAALKALGNFRAFAFAAGPGYVVPDIGDAVRFAQKKDVMLVVTGRLITMSEHGQDISLVVDLIDGGEDVEPE